VADINSVGNRLTDYMANTACLRLQLATPSTLHELPLAECQHYLTVWTEHGSSQQVIGDLCRTAIAQLRAQQFSSWRNKSPEDIMGGRLRARHCSIPAEWCSQQSQRDSRLPPCASPPAPFSAAGKGDLPR